MPDCMLIVRAWRHFYHCIGGARAKSSITWQEHFSAHTHVVGLLCPCAHPSRSGAYNRKRRNTVDVLVGNIAHAAAPIENTFRWRFHRQYSTVWCVCMNSKHTAHAWQAHFQPTGCLFASLPRQVCCFIQSSPHKFNMFVGTHSHKMCCSVHFSRRHQILYSGCIGARSIMCGLASLFLRYPQTPTTGHRAIHSEGNSHWLMNYYQPEKYIGRQWRAPTLASSHACRRVGLFVGAVEC